ncbi:purine-nucleoside phosphorylase [Candidatus Woesearchaeota archaeon]|nr:purine-nucleoside phosphorylase [Candidatus Woesearchaeota archaeon]MBT3538266.1 purine-nucleoside phosphorylase [Candidatus Woesearchaeota archaeon]MBT4717432.1 purine-nucleoside phosphorylase [Candidatus Woesearchaeota archaeon]MBT7105935.1 purine-nucleoside phosphorylase [Candidatus Woesearchaeota archaeon]MBT7930460.1 purine-nucleoside phosphorylase [Candidatus Woesearchaeota archaeon]
MGLQSIEEVFTFNRDYEAKVAETADHIRAQLGSLRPEFGITLGSGLGDIADAIEDATTISYADIPNFLVPTVEGHEGNLIFGNLEGIPVIGLSGRTHYYEYGDLPFNYGMLRTTFAVNVLADLGIANYFVTNAAGGLNQKFKVGDMMVLHSHIHNQPNPLLGEHRQFKRVDNGERVERFPPVSPTYDPELRKVLHAAGQEHRDHLHQGVYMGVTGPTYEAEAEARSFRDNADAVGMSTTGEVIVARGRGMRAVGMSCITNEISASGDNPANHDEVKRILESPEVRQRLTSTVQEFFRLYRAS